MTSAKLLSVNIGGKPVRFLYYRTPYVILTAHTPDIESTDIPLFLAADVLAGSNQMAKNHARIHARYAKDGLATRMTFNNMKIEGIHNSSVVWFYNTQGLFKVVFEHRDMNAQRDCLIQLKELWLERCHDPAPAESIEVHHQLGIGDKPETTESIKAQNTEMAVESMSLIAQPQDGCYVHIFPCDQDGYTTSLQTRERLPGTLGVANQDHAGMITSDTETTHNVNRLPLDMSHVNSHLERSCNYDNVDVLAENLCTPDKQHLDCVQCSNVYTKTTSLSHTSVNRTPESADSITTDENTCQQCPLCQCSHVCHQRTQSDADSWVMLLVDSILEVLQNRAANGLNPEQTLLRKLVLLMDFFKCESFTAEPLGEDAAFPYIVLEQYTLLIKNHDVQKLFGNKFNIPCRRNAVLCLLSEWLGSQFCSLSDTLHCKVEEFKQRNINCIENLPCPRTLVDLVFPRCMQSLLVHWLGQHDGEDAGTEGDCCAADHSYSAQAVKQPNTVASSISLPDKYPFIQFILEFANNALISGVAHVVYSRLVNSC